MPHAAYLKGADRIVGMLDAALDAYETGRGMGFDEGFEAGLEQATDIIERLRPFVRAALERSGRWHHVFQGLPEDLRRALLK